MMEPLLFAQEMVLQCTASNPKERPLIGDVLDTLERQQSELLVNKEGRG